MGRMLLILYIITITSSASFVVAQTNENQGVSKTGADIKIDLDQIYNQLGFKNFTHGFNLDLIVNDIRWYDGMENRTFIMSYLKEAVRILAQCQIRAVNVQLTKNPVLDDPKTGPFSIIDFRDTNNPLKYLRAAPPKYRPAVYFYGGNQYSPPFGANYWPDAHSCVNKANGDEYSSTPVLDLDKGNPGCYDKDLSNTIWISHRADPTGLVLAHEIGHVLFNYGHSKSGGLMSGVRDQVTELVADKFCEMAKLNNAMVFPLH